MTPSTRGPWRLALPPGRAEPDGRWPYARPRALPGGADRYATLAEFWPFYLREHSRRGTRALHLSGSALALLLAVAAVATRVWWLLLGALLCGYAFAWVGHFFVEHNRPATFTYPLKSFLSDWRLVWVTLTGRLGAELRKHGLR